MPPKARMGDAVDPRYHLKIDALRGAAWSSVFDVWVTAIMPVTLLLCLVFALPIIVLVSESIYLSTDLGNTLSSITSEGYYRFLSDPFYLTVSHDGKIETGYAHQAIAASTSGVCAAVKTLVAVMKTVEFSGTSVNQKV